MFTAIKVVFTGIQLRRRFRILLLFRELSENVLYYIKLYAQLKLNRNKTEIKQFYFSQNKTIKQPWNGLAVLANQSRYPLFNAWRTNSGYRLWLALTAETFQCCFIVLFWLKENVLFPFYFGFISIVLTAWCGPVRTLCVWGWYGAVLSKTTTPSTLAGQTEKIYSRRFLYAAAGHRTSLIWILTRNNIHASTVVGYGAGEGTGSDRDCAGSGSAVGRDFATECTQDVADSHVTWTATSNQMDLYA